MRTCRPLAPSASIRPPCRRYGRLALIARGLVEGFLTGAHKSPYKGFSVEFAEHRQYYPGDEIRHIDWRAFGKTDRYYIKEYEEETNLRAHLLVDASGSMAYTGQAPPEQVRVRPVRRRLAGLPDAAPARRRRPGHPRHQGPRRSCRRRPRPSTCSRCCTPWRRPEPGGETEPGPAVASAGRAVQTARHGRHPVRLLRPD